MNKNYLILAHSRPNQVGRLIGSLNDRDTYFYIHIDKRVDIDDYKAAIDLPNVFFLENRISCKWGDISLVQATLLCMQAVLNDNRSGSCILLSGRDYPIKTNEQLTAFLKKNAEYDFVELLPIEELWPNGHWKVRTHEYKFDISNKRYDLVVIPYFFNWKTLHPFNIWRTVKAFLHGAPNLKLIFKKRKFPSYITPFGGSQWWILKIDTIEKIFAFLDKHPDYMIYHQNALCPDEIFFHSILYHFRETNQIKVKPNLTFLNWATDDAPSPEILGTKDFKKLIQLPEPYFFARKFNAEIDSKILDLLDDHLDNS